MRPARTPAKPRQQTIDGSGTWPPPPQQRQSAGKLPVAAQRIAVPRITGLRPCVGVDGPAHEAYAAVPQTDLDPGRVRRLGPAGVAAGDPVGLNLKHRTGRVAPRPDGRLCAVVGAEHRPPRAWRIAP